MFRTIERVVLCTIQIAIAVVFLFGAYLEPHNMGLAIFGAIAVPFMFTWTYTRLKDLALWLAYKFRGAGHLKRRGEVAELDLSQRVPAAADNQALHLRDPVGRG